MKRESDTKRCSPQGHLSHAAEQRHNDISVLASVLVTLHVYIGRGAGRHFEVNVRQRFKITVTKFQFFETLYFQTL